MMSDALLLVAAFSACVVYLVMVVLARRRERELAVARAHEERLKSLTELSADWFWETDAERSLQQAKARLELALDGGNMADWHYVVAGDELYAGDGWVRFLGHDRSPVITRGEQFFATIHPDNRAAARGAWVRALKGEAAEYDAEFRAATRDGGWKWLHAKGRVTECGADGRAARMSGIVADIDARQSAETALVEADQRFRDVAAVSSEYVWEADAEWRYTYLSERVEALIGYPRAELLGRKLWEFLPLGEDRAMRAWFASHGAEGRPFRDLVHRVMTRSGGVLWQSLAGVPLRDAEGRWAGYRGTAADVTSRKQDEARI